MTQNILILDKDLTLVTPVSGEKFVQDPRDQQVIPGMNKALKLAKALGYKIAVASNQMGVNCGYKTQFDAIAEFLFLSTLFPEIKFSVYCPDEGEKITEIDDDCNVNHYQHSEWDYFSSDGRKKFNRFCKFRKPEPGMIEYILAKFSFNTKTDKCIYVGDMASDEQAAIKAGVTFVWAQIFKDRFQGIL